MRVPSDWSMAAARQLLFVQGAGDMWHPEGSGHLARYLQRELAGDYLVSAPEMPDADNPHYRPWADRIAHELKGIEGDVFLVGHSFGGSVLLKHLAEDAPHYRVAALCLVSVPDWGPKAWAIEEYAVPADLGSRLPSAPIYLYHSVDDGEVPFSHMRAYAEQLPEATVRAVPGSDHSFVEGLPILVDDIRSVGRETSGRS